MTVTSIPTADRRSHDGAAISIDGETLTIHDLAIVHGEASALAQAQLDATGPVALADLVRRALPVGLVALSVGSAGLNASSIQRTLDDFATQVDSRSQLALTRLDETSSRLRDGEASIVAAAQQVLDQLPARLDAVLGGEAGHVRAAVGEATRAVQAAGMQEMRAALAQHSEAIRAALSLDGDGPVQALRRDLMHQADSSRREIGEQLSLLRSLLQAADARKAASATSTRAVGLEWETTVSAICSDVVTAAGDRYEPTGSRPAPGSTARTGDAVATLSPAITGHGRDVRIVLEAKKRTRLTTRQFKDELASARVVREAAGALAIVPTCAEVPGGGRFGRVDDLAYVVAADDPTVVSLVYLVLRELVALVHCRQTGGDEIDLAKVETQLNVALAALADFDDVARLAGEAQKNLAKLLEVGRRAKTKLHEALTAGLEALHP